MTISTPAPESTGFADRIFVLDGGEAYVTAVSQCSPDAQSGSSPALKTADTPSMSLSTCDALAIRLPDSVIVTPT
jgi:hypothetical protein